jgi:hypothetical protein
MPTPDPPTTGASGKSRSVTHRRGKNNRLASADYTWAFRRPHCLTRRPRPLRLRAATPESNEQTVLAWSGQTSAASPTAASSASRAPFGDVRVAFAFERDCW